MAQFIQDGTCALRCALYLIREPCGRVVPDDGPDQHGGGHPIGTLHNMPTDIGPSPSGSETIPSCGNMEESGCILSSPPAYPGGQCIKVVTDNSSSVNENSRME